LYFRREDLAGPDGAAVSPAEVVDAMTDTPPIEVHAHEPGAGKIVLYRLPEPWNLPVIFAVRLSLALPLLFKAVRLARRVQGAAIRDDLGRAILDGAGRAMSWPPQDEVRAEELWFSDGGITSNFPVHLFDTPLPRWPTFGLNLGTYPVGFPH